MKKFNLLFILVLSVFFVSSCSSNDDEDELTDTDSGAVQDVDNSGDTMPDGTTNDDDKTDTSSENEDSDNDSDNVDISDTDISENDDLDPNSDQDTDPEDTDIPDTETSDNDDDTGTADTDTDSGDSQPDDDADADTSEPAFPECSPTSAKPCILGKLIWSDINSKQPQNITWLEAEEHCKDLKEGGFDDWEMPTISELRTLVQNCKKTATDGLCKVTDECTSSNSTAKCYNIDLCTSTTNAIGIERCGDKTDGSYSKLGDAALYLWSSTTSNDAGDMVWFIYFKNTDITARKKTLTGRVRCVRRTK